MTVNRDDTDGKDARSLKLRKLVERNKNLQRPHDSGSSLKAGGGLYLRNEALPKPFATFFLM